jgi:Phosphate-selective porin O and P
MANDSLPVPKESKWYDKVQIRGYVQVRYNRLFETNPDLGCEQCDRSWGDNSGFFIRRARIIFFGQLSPRVYMYIQPDFASSVSSSSLHWSQLRDAYFDVGLDSKNEFRFRIGQSKIPFGFENMQSSQNRLPLDRADALNSAITNERDLGVFFYWAPARVREIFSSLVREGLKGSGDYGVFGFGAFNGQTANRPEANNSQHLVARFTMPFKIGNQIIEPSLQAYSGRYVMQSSQLSAGVKTTGDRNYLDQRAAATFVLYPKPFGILAEYNIGRGPEYNASTDSIETRDLTGGYVTFSYMIQSNKMTYFPFVRAQYYDGAKKHEQDARAHKVNELEIGCEVQFGRNFEFVAMYTNSTRTTSDRANELNRQSGRLLRLQAQLNF